MATTIEDITTGYGGTGAFDVLMASVDSHLNAEYQAGRITGDTFATVYTQALIQTLAQSIQYVIAEDEARRKDELNNDQLLLNAAQIELMNAQTALVEQQTVTETAQTVNPAGFPGGTAGVVGKQMELYQAQAEGFERDAEQKATKILVDTWNVRRSTDAATSASDINHLDDTTIGKAVTTLLSGIGTSPG